MNFEFTIHPPYVRVFQIAFLLPPPHSITSFLFYKTDIDIFQFKILNFMIFYQFFLNFSYYSFNLKKYIKLINYTYKYFTLLFLNIKYDYHKFLSILIILLIDYFFRKYNI